MLGAEVGYEGALNRQPKLPGLELVLKRRNAGEPAGTDGAHRRKTVGSPVGVATRISMAAGEAGAVARESWRARAGRVGILVGVWKLGTVWTSAGWRALAPRTKEARHRQVRGTDCCQRIVVCAGACHAAGCRLQVAGCRLQGFARSSPSGGLPDDSARAVPATTRSQRAKALANGAWGSREPRQSCESR
jgi:hypothetical protein